MHARHAFGARGIPDVDPRADDVLELAAERLDGGADLVEDVDGLPLGVCRAHDGALAVRGGRAADEDAVAGAHCAGVARDRLPTAAGVDHQTLGPDRARRRREDAWQPRQMMTQIARRGEERRLSVFIAAVAGHRTQDRLRLGEPRAVGAVELEGEQREVVAAMLTLAESRAD